MSPMLFASGTGQEAARTSVHQTTVRYGATRAALATIGKHVHRLRLANGEPHRAQNAHGSQPERPQLVRPLRALTLTGSIGMRGSLDDLSRDKDGNAAGTEISHFQIGVDPTARLNSQCCTIVAFDFQSDVAAWRKPVHAFDADQLVALQLE